MMGLNDLFTTLLVFKSDFYLWDIGADWWQEQNGTWLNQ